MDPTDCVATDRGAICAATAAPDPLDDPPGVRVTLCGLVVGPALAIAYSVVTVVPRMTAPAGIILTPTTVSASGRRFQHTRKTGEAIARRRALC